MGRIEREVEGKVRVNMIIAHCIYYVILKQATKVLNNKHTLECFLQSTLKDVWVISIP